MTFQPDYPGTTHVVPAHPTNIRPGPNNPKVLVLHTPEEPVDDYESTPAYFAQPNRSASTHYYSDSDGDWYQLVPESEMAIANGVIGKPYPKDTDPNVTLNRQSLSVEIEGYAAGMHRTMPQGGLQWRAVVEWIVDRAKHYSIPIDREHVIRHDEVANNRSDPGTLNVELIVKDAQMLAAEEDDVAGDFPLAFRKKQNQRTYLINYAANTATYVTDPKAIKAARDLGEAAPPPTPQVPDGYFGLFKVIE
jgi:N-acetyl-anhydromuramyl-L-alanine amidase AmpD